MPASSSLPQDLPPEGAGEYVATTVAAATTSVAAIEMRYQRLAAFTGQIFWQTATDDLALGAESWCAFTGQSRAAAKEWGWLDAVHPDDRLRIQEQWVRALKEQIPYRAEFRIRRIDGMYRVFAMQGIPMQDDPQQPPIWVGSGLDITERHQMEAEYAALLRRENDVRAQLTSMLEVLPAGVAIYSATGQLLEQNAIAAQLTQQTIVPGEAPTNRHRRYGMRRVDHSPMPEAESPSGRARRGETFQDYECIIQGAAGEEIHLLTCGAPLRNGQGQAIGGIVIFQDVTALRALEQQTQRALNAVLAMAGMVVQSTGTNKATNAKQIAELTRSVLGCSRVSIAVIDPETEYLTPVTVVGLTPEQEREWWATQPRNARLGEGATPEHAAILMAGQVLTLDISQPPYNAAPNPFQIATILIAPLLIGERVVGLLSLDYSGAQHDFTAEERSLAAGVARLAALVFERERLIAERSAAEARETALAETNSRMQTFLGIVGHELRTPVTTIKANAQLVERTVRAALTSDLPPTLVSRLERACAMLSQTDRQANRLNRLIEDVLDVTRIQSGKLELRLATIDLGTVVREMVKAQRQAWPQREITLTLPAQPCAVLADADRIGQVVTNYLTNALKYSAPDTSVAVRMTCTAQRVRVAVRDHGPGLPPDAITHIWEPFHQVEGIHQQSGSGMGLGLHICQEIVARHSGQVGVASKVGQGSPSGSPCPAEAINVRLWVAGAPSAHGMMLDSLPGTRRNRRRR